MLDYFDTSSFPLHPEPDLGVVHYLETLSFDGGVPFEDLEELKDKESKRENCGKVFNKFVGQITGTVKYIAMRCRKWWCPECGKRDGAIHRARMMGVYKKIGLLIKSAVLKQMIFTIPRDAENEFLSKSRLNSLGRAASKIVKKYFPGLRCIRVIQLFGDRDKARYRPHVHILILDRRGCLLMMTREELRAMNEAWRLSVQGILGRPVKITDIHYSFATTQQKIAHRLRYTMRLCPDYENHLALRRNLPLLNFVENKLTGFRFITYFGQGWRKNVNDLDENDAGEQEKMIQGEKFIYQPGESMTRTEFFLRYKPWEYQENSPGIYTILTKQ